MIPNGNKNISVNNFNLAPFIPSKIVDALISSKAVEAENLFKCLKYSDSDCLDKPNLASKEKRDMIWTPKKKDWTHEENFNIFLKPLVGNSLDTSEQQTQLRIYESNIMPMTIYQSVFSFAFDFITEEKTSQIFVDGIMVERTSFMQSCVLTIMNGRDLGIGINFFQFSKDFNRYSGSMLNISNSKSFYGRTLVMGLSYSNIAEGGC